MNDTTITLGELLTHSDHIVSRNAMSILKQLKRLQNIKEVETIKECYSKLKIKTIA
jgi:hypothetical protein